MILSFKELITEAKFKIVKKDKEVNGKFKKNVTTPLCVDTDGNKAPGWKAILKARKCVKMTGEEILNKKKGAKVAARKRQKIINKTNLKRLKLAKKRGGRVDESKVDITPVKDFIRDNLEIKIKNIVYGTKFVDIVFHTEKLLLNVYDELLDIDDIMANYSFSIIENRNYYAIRFMI